MIFLWDEKVSFLLSSRYDSLEAGAGETGNSEDGDQEDDLDRDDDGTTRYVSPTK